MTKQNEKDAKRVPELRFKGFADAWEQRQLGEFGTIAMCKRIFKNQTSESGEIPFYKIGTFGGKPNAYITRKLFNEYKHQYPYPQEGDILISASGSIGRTVVYTGQEAYYQDSNIVWLRHNDLITNSFLEQLYKVIKWDGVEGSTIKRLYNSTILKTRVTIPSVPEQEKIGQLFQKLDHTITLHEEKQKQLEQLKKALLQKMFADKSGYPKLRFKGFTDTWEQRKLVDVVNIYDGVHQTPDYQEHGIMFLSVENINNLSSNKYISEEAFQNDFKVYPRKNDILMTRIGDIGSANIIKTDEKIAYYVSLALLKPKTINSEFLLSLITSSNFQKELKKRSLLTATPKKINKDEIGKVSICITIGYVEQEKLGQFFQKLDHTINLHAKKIEQLKQLKQALLQKMFV